jgi:hypothetical protein
VNPAEVDDEGIVREVARCFEAYESALMAHDLDTLNGFFWMDERLTRYGIADRQHGFAEQAAFRAASPAPNFTRRLENLRIHAFGRDCAVAQVEFVRSDTPLRGFQSQTWVRFDGAGWKIVAAHVGMIPFPG